MQRTKRSPSFAESPPPAAPAETRMRKSRLAESLDPEAGLATAEYAVITIAAMGFAGLLVLLLKSDAVTGVISQVGTAIVNALGG